MGTTGNSIRVKRGFNPPPETTDPSQFAPYELGWSMNHKSLYVYNALEVTEDTPGAIKIGEKYYLDLEVIPTSNYVSDDFCVDMNELIDFYKRMFGAGSEWIGDEPEEWHFPWE